MQLAVPIALQQLLLAAVSAGDSLMLGLVDGNAMAAVSLASNMEFVENLFLSALVGGATILSAQYWGKGDRGTIERIFGLILRYAAVISVLFVVLAIVMPAYVMRLFTNEPELISIGVQYIRMATGSYLLTGISQCYLCVMKATGQTRQSVLISSSALCLDTVLNAVFILGLHMGATGAALTTSITRAIELAALLFYSRRMTVRPRIWSQVSSEVHRDFLQCSIPHLINSLVWGLGTAVYASIIGHLGTAITEAYSAATIIRNLSLSLSRGLGQGTEIALADMLGAGEIDGARRLGRRASELSVGAGVVCALLVLLIGPLLSHIMVLDIMARDDLRIMIYISAFYVMTQCYNNVVICGIFAAGGDTAFDAYSVAVTMWLGIIPLAAAAAYWWQLPSLVVYLILSLDEAIKIPWVHAHYRQYRWLRNMTRAE